MKKLWAGRFTKNTSKLAEDYSQSISFDKRLWSYDIKGSIAHTQMLAKQKIISKTDSLKIIQGLNKIYTEIENGTFKFKTEMEDIHLNIESALIEKIGDIGGKLHTARSRNDQISLDLRLYLKYEVKKILVLLKNLESFFVRLAEKNLDIIMPGYTHTQKAQPILLSHHLMAYAQMFDRDRERFLNALKRIDIMPLGACALAGTSLPIDRAYTSKLLGFAHISENSIDTVSDRDFAIEFLSCASLLMMHLSRISEELVLWSTKEFNFIEVSDAFTTGSSIMPQKKNLDIAELMRGKTGRIYGNLVALLTIMKGLPLSYNRDMQEDKEPVFNTVDTVKSSIKILGEIMENLKFNKKRMFVEADNNYSTATDIAEYLVSKGLPFRTAHTITGKIVKYCIDKNKKLSELTIDEYNLFSNLIFKDIYNFIKTENSVNSRKSYGGTSPDEVKNQIKRFKHKLRSPF